MEIQTLILHPGPSLAPTARPEGEARGECAAGVRKSRERQEGRARQGVGRERTFPVSSANCTVMTVLLSEIYPGKQSAVPADTYLLHGDGLALETNEQFLLIKKLVVTQTPGRSQRSWEPVPPSFP